MGLIIGISGKARSGKDTFGNALKIASHKYGLNVELHSFARKLKDIAKDNFGLTDEQLNGLEKESHIERWNCTPRVIMQKLGEGYRNIYPNYWVDSVLDKYNPDSGIIMVITDCRFKNEFIGIQYKGGLVVRMERDESLRGVVSNPNHPSETDLDRSSFERVIDNNGTLDELYRKAVELLGDVI
jgi:hypothetical protein